MLGLGTASAEGENEVVPQISDLRAARTTPVARGAKPGRPGTGDGDAAAQAELRLEEIQAELAGKNVTAEMRATLTAESLKIRGLDTLFKPKAGAQKLFTVPNQH